MIGKAIAAAVGLPLALALVTGCQQPTPDSCRLNNTATGAAVGALGGAAVGTVIAAASHASGGAFAAAALGGAVIGGVIGAMAGQAQDKACHDMAMKQALDEAYALNQAREAELAAARSAGRRAPASAAASQQYQSVAWANQMTNKTGTITPLQTVPDTSAAQICMTYADQQIVNGTSTTVTGKSCRGADGEWKPVT